MARVVNATARQFDEVEHHLFDTLTSHTARAGEGTFVHCRKCGTDHLIEGLPVESVHRSAEGVVGYLRCPGAHLLIHTFAEAYPTPPPPPSVVALRARLAAEAAAESARAGHS